MIITIDLAPDEEARLEKKAARQGQDAVAYAASLVRRDLNQEEPEDERERRLAALAEIQSGAFAHLDPSTLMARKAEEIALEDRRWKNREPQLWMDWSPMGAMCASPML